MPKRAKGKAEDAVWQDPSMLKFTETLKQVLSVPKTELDRREAEWRKEREAKRTK